ncbi:hypothetical protein [Pararhizobium haloflavum]|uniref:hypothetical protein n=1 Tax=Pararhizobium haloflavum TaxID=2037914 RepID=UPI0012FFFD7A|nr:hypothetical protein [Pararhizobium haloflavum]
MDLTVVEALRIALAKSKANTMQRYLIEMALMEAIAPDRQELVPEHRTHLQ